MTNYDEDHIDFSDFDDHEEQNYEVKRSRKSNLVFGWILLVFFIVAATLAYVLNVAKQKPESPQALVAAAFNLTITAPTEWKPGMGPKPLIYHPAATPAPQWQAMYQCPTHGINGKPQFNKKGVPYCAICNQQMTVTK